MLKLFRSKKALDRIQSVLRGHSGGVFRRLDHNREIVETLRRDAPEFFEKEYLEDKLKSLDEFLCELAKVAELEVPNPMSSFPRPWPKNCAPDINPSKKTQATSLQQNFTLLQDAKECNRHESIAQLEKILARLRAGDI